MMPGAKGGAFLVAFSMATMAAPAADLERGRLLHDRNCFHCHDASVYTRDDRRVKSLEQLRRQVVRCTLSLELQWFEEDIADVVGHLNRGYYRF